jgi:hypothetical protein
MQAGGPLGGLLNSAARALVKAKEKNKNIVRILKYDWEPDHPPELRNSFEDSEGQLWEVWTVPEESLGQVS